MNPWEEYADKPATPTKEVGPWTEYAPPKRRALPPQKEKLSKDMPWYEKAAVGAGAATARAGRGLGKLLQATGFQAAPLGGKPEDQFNLDKELANSDENAALYKANHPGGWATAGEVAADVAMSAIPVAKGGKLLTKALGAAPGAPVLADMAANAGWNAATSPENRGTAAGIGAASALGGHLLPQAVARVGQPIVPKGEAKALFDQGVPLTPGQAGGRLARSLEGSTQAITGNPVARAFHLDRPAKSIADAQQSGIEWATAAGASPEFLAKAGSVSEAGGLATLGTILSMLGIHVGSGAPAAAAAALYGTDLGRRFLMGDLPAQEVLKQAPELAPHLSQIIRAMSTQTTQE